MSRRLDIRRIEGRTATRVSRTPRRTHEDVLVVGQPALISLEDLKPSEADLISFWVTGEVTLTVSGQSEPLPLDTPLTLSELGESLELIARTYSEKLRDRWLEITFLDAQEKPQSIYELELTAIRVCLDVDADRDGVVEENSPYKNDWKWGKDGYGAILLVNSDQDNNGTDDVNFEDYRLNGLLDIKDLSLMVVRKTGPGRLPSGCELRLSVSRSDSRRVRVFDELDGNRGYELIGPGKSQGYLRERDTEKNLFLAIEGLHYPDRDFDGVITVDLSLIQDRQEIYSDRVRFQVAPWIMTPHTLSPKTVYVSRLESGSNAPMIEDIRQLVGLAQAQLEVVAPHVNRGDRWMQDEIEIGYCQSPGHLMYVVLDSPRNRGLDEFPEEHLLGTDFGYVTRDTGEGGNTLDSFGNLEVSPPVTVKGTTYPFGRILYGGNHPDAPEYNTQMMGVVRDFLIAQKIQAPVELFSDWLSVGHIDEFMTFVPTPTPKGFKLLLASPSKCFSLLQDLQEKGQGDLLLREGKEISSRDAAISVSDILNDTKLRKDNDRFQEYINWNRTILKAELGLEEGDIIDLPSLFEATRNGRAETFFPNMVNMLVLGKELGIPKPYGPQIDGQCQFEAYVKTQLDPLGLNCHFIDDWTSYFLGRGDIHCGTNTRRQPFTQPWWEISLVTNGN
ncbi:Protein-arginine deiminase [Rippkaea orientalis PCC 8801]|uniref:Protein-arginine deiminase n=1 Tax=Rippkaea orientalis (strain PCC 8801 / RF-1) TaxID=41431 RepID=B7K011_RIPO1|nr:protein-arginine deiminase family protein [Rippkaea orientalis]ACK66158.1 Protein-arginine deiminase [Rippkaea orientalis PCC 8801]